MPGLAISERLGTQRQLADSLKDARTLADHQRRFIQFQTELTQHGVALHPTIVAQISADPVRLAAFQSRDFFNRGTASEHILRVAKAPTLIDGQPSAQLAAQLVNMVGNGTLNANVYGMSYARTTLQIFGQHHAGELSRILADLGVDGRTKLANGENLAWNPQVFPVQANRHADWLWAGVNHLATHRVLPRGGVLSPDAPSASQAQMANLTSRLFGLPFVNVSGPTAIPHLNEVTQDVGPVLAAYGPHAGSVARVNGRQPMSLEVGQRQPIVYQQNPLGYVVVPAEMAAEKGIEAIQYGTGGDTDYTYPPRAPAGPAAPAVAGKARPAPPTSRTPTAQQMADLLSERGVAISPEVVQKVAVEPARLAALHSLDFDGESTAFEHILKTAEARTLVDGRPSSELARDLFGLVGSSRYAHGSARCYARTTHTIFTLHHPAEFARLVGQLATKGEVTLGSGEAVRWNPQALPKPAVVPTADFLWGNLNHLIRHRVLPRGSQLNTEAEVASQGQMANIYSRLFGEPFVNVQGAWALPHLNRIIADVGPLPAEYGAHGGSVASVTPQNMTLSLEPGATQPEPVMDIGYVVFPEREATALNLQPLQYGESDMSYADLPVPDPAPATSRRTRARH
ncbi:MAG TPA: hypothetical protein VH208_08980 [Myxococcaceae bacterium]|nr:hypothetical protein [Myxococcaceae bacterium]